MDEWNRTMPYLKQKDDILEETKHGPLSVMILAGTLNLVIILSYKKSMTIASVSFLVGMTPTHLVK